MGIVAEYNGLTRADYLKQIVRDDILPGITRDEKLNLPCNIWKEQSPPPCNTTDKEHRPQSPTAPILQPEALEALRERAKVGTKVR